MGGGRWANFGSFRAAESATLGTGKAGFRQFWPFWGAKTPDFCQTWNANSAHPGRHRGTKTVNFGSFRAAASAALDPGTADCRIFWPFLGPQDARFRSKLEGYLGPSWLTQERKNGQLGSNWRRLVGQFWFISGRRVSHFRPRDGRFSPILAIFRAPRGPISVKVETLPRPILVDTRVQKRSIWVKLEAVGGPILVPFGPPSQPLWAPGRPIFANFGYFWGTKTPDFG